MKTLSFIKIIKALYCNGLTNYFGTFLFALKAGTKWQKGLANNLLMRSI
jgi:hypothetical protein